MKCIEVKNISKTYENGVVACDDITFDLESGEILGIVGPNGAGKTTLTSMISGELKPTGGLINVFGKQYQVIPDSVKYDFGVMPQEYGLHTFLTSEQEIYFLSQLSGLTREVARARTDDVIKTLGMEDYRNKPIGVLSGGMKHRVLLASAIAHQPRILLLDEPSAGLDPNGKILMWNVLKEMRKNGTSIILTSHDMNEIQTMADRIILINKGRIVRQGTTREIRELYGSTWVVKITVEDVKNTENFLTIIDQLNIKFYLRKEVNENDIRLFFDNLHNVILFLNNMDSQLCQLPFKDLAITMPSIEDVFIHFMGDATIEK